jgi:hypothetical protein
MHPENSVMRIRPISGPQKTAGSYLQYSMPMWQELYWGRWQTMGLETQGTQVKLGSNSLGKIQTSTAFI